MDKQFRSILEEGAALAGVEMTSGQADMMDALKAYLVEENEKFNLTGIKDDMGIAIKHMVYSLTLLKVEGVSGCGSFIDIGTGAGFPGLVLAIMFPDTKAVLVDSVGKKVAFVRAAAEKLGLKGVTALTGRAEDLAKAPEHREKYGFSVSRGVSSISTSAEYCIPFLRKGGIFVAMKGPGAENEIDDGKAAFFALGAKLREMRRFTLPFGQGERVLVVADKLSPTPNRFPRKTGEPQSRPITRKQDMG